MSIKKDDAMLLHAFIEEYVEIIESNGHTILNVKPEALQLLASEALEDVSFLLRSSHLAGLGKILKEMA